MEGKWSSSEFGKEVKKVSLMSAPMVAFMVMHYLLPFVSLLMVGHLNDELLLSGVSMANSFVAMFWDMHSTVRRRLWIGLQIWLLWSLSQLYWKPHKYYFQARVARGTGWQNIGAYVNLGAYYLCGTPTGVVLAFVLHLKVKGLWIGLLTGSTVQVVLLAIKTSLTNWQKQASKVRERIFEGDS